jgi:hypothetical protein
MVFAAERCKKLAGCYEQMAAHDDAPITTRMHFARKANSYRITGRLAVLDEVNAKKIKCAAPSLNLFATPAMFSCAGRSRAA